MTGNHDVDVLVVGARCAGAATALLLARGGMRVLAVDRAGYGADTLSTHALTRPAVLQLSRWGVLDDVRRAGTPTVTSVVQHYGDDAVAIPIHPAGDVDGLYAPRRTVLDRILVDAAERAGADIRHRTAVRDLRTGRDGRVRGAVLEDATGRRVVRCRLVVGADGADSFVARRVRAPLEFVDPAAGAAVYTYVPGLDRHAYHNYFRPGLIAGVIPTNGGDANVWVSVAADRFRREGRGDVARFHDRMLRVADARLASEVRANHDGAGYRTFVGRPAFVRRSWGPGWALVGDAAYFRDPLSAHGITDALIAAELLARAVLGTADGPGERVALAAQAAARMRLARPMLAAIGHLASFRWSVADVQAAHRAMNGVLRREWSTIAALGTASGRGDVGRAPVPGRVPAYFLGRPNSAYLARFAVAPG